MQAGPGFGALWKGVPFPRVARSSDGETRDLETFDYHGACLGGDPECHSGWHLLSWIPTEAVRHCPRVAGQPRPGARGAEPHDPRRPCPPIPLPWHVRHRADRAGCGRDLLPAEYIGAPGLAPRVAALFASGGAGDG